MSEIPADPAAAAPAAAKPAGLPGAVSRHARRYAAAYLRAGLYIALAVITNFGSTFGELTAEAAAKMTWLQWVCLGLKPLGAGITAAVAFLDQTLARIAANDPGSPQNQTAAPFGGSGPTRQN